MVSYIEMTYSIIKLILKIKLKNERGEHVWCESVSGRNSFDKGVKYDEWFKD